jgi:hypothetical protein
MVIIHTPVANADDFSNDLAADVSKTEIQSR